VTHALHAGRSSNRRDRRMELLELGVEAVFEPPACIGVT
jgi:hypothetical protein